MLGQDVTPITKMIVTKRGPQERREDDREGEPRDHEEPVVMKCISRVGLAPPKYPDTIPTAPRSTWPRSMAVKPTISETREPATTRPRTETPEVVGPERIRERRRRQDAVRPRWRGRVGLGRQQRSEDRQEDEEDQDDQPDHALTVPPERAPDPDRARRRRVRASCRGVRGTSTGGGFRSSRRWRLLRPPSPAGRCSRT